MIKHRFWDYPRLCLCLVFTCILFSCGVKHQVNGVVGLPANNNGWQVDIWLHISNAGWNLPVNDKIILAPYAVKKLLNGNNESGVLILSYHIQRREQINDLTEMLLTIGEIENIRITSFKALNTP